MTAQTPERDSEPEIPVRLVQLWLCDPCLDGKGGECHTPGCSLWMRAAPDLPVREQPGVTVRDAAPLALVYGEAACDAIIDDEEEGAVPCGALSRFVVSRSDGDKSFGAQGGTEEACEAHLAEAVAGMADGDEGIWAAVAIRWDGDAPGDDEQRAADLRAHAAGMGGPSPAWVTDGTAGLGSVDIGSPEDGDYDDCEPTL